MERYPTFRAYSAGGVVFRLISSAMHAEQARAAEKSLSDSHGDNVPSAHALDQVEVALVGRSHSGMWALPKGTPRAGETIEQVAVREVQEETGLQVRLITYIGVVSYSFI